MKKILLMLILVTGMLNYSFAQDGNPTTSTEVQQVEATDNTHNNAVTDNLASKSSEASRSTAAQRKDERVESASGPNGEPVFVDSDSMHYYWNGKDDKVFVGRPGLKEKKRG